MSDVLLVAAFQFGNPVATFIHMKINDLLHRPCNVCLDRFHGLPFGVGARQAGHAFRT
jgi:hypothetical protein